MRKAERTLKSAVEKAEEILAEYVEPGPRDCERTINRLLNVLDSNAVGEALQKLEEREHGGRPEAARPSGRIAHQH